MLTEELCPLEHEQATKLSRALDLLRASCLADAELFVAYPQWWNGGQFVNGTDSVFVGDLPNGQTNDPFMQACKSFFDHAGSVINSRSKPTPNPQEQIKHKVLMMECYDQIQRMNDGQLPKDCFTACDCAIELVSLKPGQDRWTQLLRPSGNGPSTRATLMGGAQRY